MANLWEFLARIEWADHEDRVAIIEHLAAFRMRKTLRLLDQLATVFPETPTSVGTSAESTTGKIASMTSPANAAVTATGITLIEDW